MRVTSFARRVGWYPRALLVGNPLIRPSDRWESIVVLAALVVALCAIPFAAQAGDQVYETGVRTAERQAHDRHPVQGVVVEVSTGMPADFDSPSFARVQWQDGARQRTAQAMLPGTVELDSHVTIWLDDAQKVVAAPVTPDDVRVSAIGAAGTVWVCIVAFCALLALVARRGLDRSRDLAWERELRLLAHNDDGWANRHL